MDILNCQIPTTSPHAATMGGGGGGGGGRVIDTCIIRMWLAAPPIIGSLIIVRSFRLKCHVIGVQNVRGSRQILP